MMMAMMITKRKACCSRFSMRLRTKSKHTTLFRARRSLGKRKSRKEDEGARNSALVEVGRRVPVFSTHGFCLVPCPGPV
ncbi:hypothetical protein CH063_10475 [Colletotrichum higginsianum]|uniref:Uncharacterized protein n=1 Tax=Colletotrichum higginsianum (strain IMI 349063) TaxID=759273 RepID=H1VHK9_COLHI|nr:hypothetical protein CH063_10475 [Colletotrichum higginsianum]